MITYIEFLSKQLQEMVERYINVQKYTYVHASFQ